MIKLMSFILCFFSVYSYAQKSKPNPNCWKFEINFETAQIYTNSAKYQEHLKYWSTFNKVTPDPFSLSKAYMTYKSEIKKTEKFSKDKVKHCYMGCRIAAETDLPTAEYVAWSKERDDITDCKASTHFEIVDYEATVDGANHADTSVNCEKYCLTHW